MNFLPTTLKEANKMGYKYLDVIIISADAYVDHPSFAGAIIGRFLQSLGLCVGIIPQPDWHNTDDFKKLGKPGLFFGITGGNLDSMISLYTAQRKRRKRDFYSEDGRTGKRPYLPSVVYSNRVKEVYKGVPIILGGIEASLRRVAHYDYYSDKIRPSILLDSKADLLVFGNGEAPLKDIIKRLKAGNTVDQIKDVKGTVVPVKHSEKKFLKNIITLPSFEDVKNKKDDFLKMTRVIMDNLNPYNAKQLFQETGSRGVLINPPSLPLDTHIIDQVYDLEFNYNPHPMYKGKIPALDVVKNSISSHRGCYGGCNFCSLYLHQGKFIQSRSRLSIIKEVKRLIKRSKKSVVISDIGGPTANMYGTDCKDIESKKKCRRKSCLYPAICKNLKISQDSYLKLLDHVRINPNVKSVYVNSGIRYDLALPSSDFISEIVKHYTPGQLSVAPEHSVAEVLKKMGKPSIEIYNKFEKEFKRECRKSGKKQYIIPYFIIGYPGTDNKTEYKLSEYLRKHRIKGDQIQEFYPTPMTVATAMYYTGKDVFTGESINVEKKLSVKKSWKDMVQY